LKAPSFSPRLDDLFTLLTFELVPHFRLSAVLEQQDGKMSLKVHIAGGSIKGKN
jgi:hypothetical protein